ncbi:MAG: hypothetical protein DCC67_11795 [Planctomycetota bacterium]|nr:MAG: hypothetical protein DCC67_11795 [Planctomycetota bacterium]
MRETSWNSPPSLRRLGRCVCLACLTGFLAPHDLGAEPAVGPRAEVVVQLAGMLQSPPAAPSAERSAPPVEIVEPLEPPQPPRRSPRQYRPVTALLADASLPEGLLPEQVDAEAVRDPAATAPEVVDARLAGGWADQPYFWSATQLCHGPLYFEEVNLERYGYQCHPAVQPLLSGAHFFLTVPTLPYQMTVHPPRECIYTLGHYRPGSRVPWQRQRLPWDARGATVEAAVAVGLVFLIP